MIPIVLLAFFGLSSFGSVFAADNNYCSTTTINYNSTQLITKIHISKDKTLVDVDEKIDGNIDRFNNDNSNILTCKNIGLWDKVEQNDLENFLKQMSSSQIVKDYESCKKSHCGNMRDPIVKNLQKLINDKCYRQTSSDGSIGILTLKATQDCCYGDEKKGYINYLGNLTDGYLTFSDGKLTDPKGIIFGEIICDNGYELKDKCCLPKPEKTITKSCRASTDSKIQIIDLKNESNPQCGVLCQEDCTILSGTLSSDNKKCNIAVANNICETTTDTEIKRIYDCKANYVSLFVKNDPSCIKTCETKTIEKVKAISSEFATYADKFSEYIQKYLDKDGCCIDKKVKKDPALFTAICPATETQCDLGNLKYIDKIDDLKMYCPEPTPPCPIGSEPKSSGGCCFMTCNDGTTIGSDCKKECKSGDPSDKCVEETVDSLTTKKFTTLGMCTEVIVPPKPNCDPAKSCCGIDLNTDVPFIGNCIEFGAYNGKFGKADGKLYVNPLNAFPVLMSGLSKIMVTVILIFSFIALISAGVMMTNTSSFSKGKSLLQAVVVGLVILGTVLIILKLINPNVF